MTIIEKEISRATHALHDAILVGDERAAVRTVRQLCRISDAMRDERGRRPKVSLPKPLAPSPRHA